VAFSASAANEEAIAGATEAAKAWLVLTDTGDAAKSWETAASMFQIVVSKEQWARSLAEVRGPFGALQSRTLKSATFTRTMIGAPEGEYVVLLYASRFEKRSSAIETVTPTRERDGSWKVSGYFIK
jgi:hypothetical protein